MRLPDFMKSISRFSLSFLFLILFFPGDVFAGHKLDSLLAVAEKQSDRDTGSVNSWIEVYWAARHAKDSTALSYLNKAKDLAVKLKDDKKTGTCLLYIGHYYLDFEKFGLALKAIRECQDFFRKNGNFDGTLETYSELASYYYETNDFKHALSLSDTILALNASHKPENENRIATMQTLIGDIHIAQGKYDDAIKAFTIVRQIYQSHDKKKDLATVLRNIGVIYIYQNNYKMALDYFLQALELDKENGDQRMLSASYNNVGGVYKYLNDYGNAEKNYLAGLDIARDGKQRKMEAMCLNNLGELFTIKKDFPKALGYISESIKIREDLGDQKGIADANLNMGQIYLKQGDHPHSLEVLQKAREILEKMNAQEQLKEIFLAISNNYTEMNDFKNALTYFRKYNTIKDTLLNANISKQIAEVNTKFETEKKEAQIVLLNKDKIVSDAELARTNAEIQQKNTQRNAFIIGFGLVLVLSAFIFRSYRQKQKANEIISQQNMELAAQKAEVILQKDVIEEKSTAILDSIQYARRIQRALLASSPLLEKNLGEFFILYKPKDIVSGDFYWAAESKDGSNRFLIGVADCTGHGVPGAFMSLLNISLLNETVAEKKILRPDLILNTVREGIIKALNPEGTETESKDGMDCTLCAFDLKNRKLDFACSNNPIWLMRDNKLEDFHADKFPVGIHHGAQTPFTHQSIALQKGDMIYMLTDGYADQFGGPKGKKFKYKQLQQLIRENSGRSLEEQKQVLESTLEDWKGGLEQVDDILIVGIRV
jgi:serine phosphatase RsbU (regulator of sigma subunit)